MKRLGLLLRAVLAVGALAMPVVVSPPSASGAAMYAALCPNFSGGANFGRHVGVTPTDTNFVLYFECNAVVAGGPSTVKGAKSISFHAAAPLDWCNGSSAGTGSIAGSALSPISGTFTFTKTPNHYELTGEFTKGWRKVAVRVSGDLSNHYPGPCHYNTAAFSGRATFHELSQAHAHYTAIAQGGIVISPGWSATATASQSFSLTGTAIGVIGGVPTQCSLSLAGSSTAPETAAAGTGSLGGSCSAPGFSVSCVGEYVRTAAAMQVLADCPNFENGVMLATFAVHPSNVNPITSATFAGPLSLQ